MGRAYAGVLGSIAFGVVVARSLIDGESAASALYTASLALFAFAAFGYVIGFIADRTIVESVEVRLHAQLRAEGAPQAVAMKGMKAARGTDEPA